MDKKNNGAVLIIGLIGLGLLFLLLRSRSGPVGTPAYSYQEPITLRLQPSGVQQPASQEPDGGRHYRNKEIRNIEYNTDGLPTKIEIIRDYTVG